MSLNTLLWSTRPIVGSESNLEPYSIEMLLLKLEPVVFLLIFVLKLYARILKLNRREMSNQPTKQASYCLYKRLYHVSLYKQTQH